MGTDAADTTAATPTTTSAPTLADYARHSAYSDPGPHAALLTSVGADPASVGAAACATIVHYRVGAPDLTAEQGDDMDRRWLSSILDAAAARQGGPLATPRPFARQVAGCCRDHSLFALGALRSHGIPARSRIGFAAYFEPPFFHDHVVVEHWDAGMGRWVRWDPELTPEGPWTFDVRDMPTGPGSPFPTAAEVWRSIRSGEADPESYGATPQALHLRGKDFVRRYVMLEVAHRMREELLLWDVWGVWPTDLVDLAPQIEGTAGESLHLVVQGEEHSDALADALAELIVAADAGDESAAAELAARYAAGLGPRRRVLTASPSGRYGVTDLVARTTGWVVTERGSFVV